MKITSVFILGASCLVTAGCSGGAYVNPYVEKTNSLESNMTFSLISCGADFYTPPIVEFTNGNNELVRARAQVGFFNDSGTMVDSQWADADVPANTTAQGDSIIGTDAYWSTCEIIETEATPHDF